jgi:hypothetical protein
VTATYPAPMRPIEQRAVVADNHEDFWFLKKIYGSWKSMYDPSFVLEIPIPE